MKIFKIAFLLLPWAAFAQNLLQDQEGFSNIIVSSTLLNLDITNKVATFDYVNDYSFSSTENLIYGIQIKGAVENDAGVIFTDEKIASNSSLDFLFGYSVKSKIKNKTERLQIIISESNLLTGELEKSVKNLNEFVEGIDETLARKNTLLEVIKVKSSITKNIVNTEVITKHIKVLNDAYKSALTNLNKENDKIEDNKEKEDGLKEITRLINQADPAYTEISNSLAIMLNISKNIDQKLSEYNDFDETLDFYRRRNLFFIRGGFNGSSFKYDSNPDAITINDRFEDVTFNGWNAEAGYNYNRRLTYFGMSLSSSYTNNLSGLDDTTFTLKTSGDLITDGDFSTSKTITAMSGMFEKFIRTSINVDFSRVIRVNKKDSLYLSANTYLRKRFYSNTTNLKNNTVLGVGLNAINSKSGSLLGGIFVQTNDLSGVNADIGSSLGERITFGIVAKASFKATSIRD